MAAVTLTFSFPMTMKLSSNISFIRPTKFQTKEFQPSYSLFLKPLTNSSTIQSKFSHFNFQIYAQKDPNDLVQDLKVPTQWLDPSIAIQESEWLRVTLHKWLDDEYCPEETNIEISKVAADSYYRSLVEGETDIGDILLKMAIDLESISYQDSFHGAFSSANAAINLIIQRMDQL